MSVLKRKRELRESGNVPSFMRDVLAGRKGVHAVWGKEVISTAAMATEIVPRLFYYSTSV
jgi:hypothetical protein